ncbi:MAG: HAD family phosphatase [Clostridia bacterium]|nr:HAD family phosphatase [Clostridia bacterium]
MSQSLQNVAGVIFDMDGTIFDTERVWQEVFVRANDKFGVTFSEEFRQNTCGKNEATIRAELLACYPQLDAEGYRNFIIASVEEKLARGEVDVKKGFAELIGYLKENGYKTALATSSNRSRAERLFQMKGWAMSQLFDSCVFGDDEGVKSKPDPDMFVRSAKKMGLAEERCVVLEDSINGIKAAKNGGLLPVMVIDLIAPDVYCEENCFAICNDLGEVVDLLKKHTINI